MLELIYMTQKGCIQLIYLAQISLYYKIQCRLPIYVEPSFVLLIICICFFYHQIFAVLYITIYLWLFYLHFSSAKEKSKCKWFMQRDTTYIERYLTLYYRKLNFYFQSLYVVDHIDWLFVTGLRNRTIFKSCIW